MLKKNSATNYDTLWATLGVFTATVQGEVPASGGGTSNFLRADGTWAAPPSAPVKDVFRADKGGTDVPGWANGTWTKISCQNIVINQNSKYSNATFRFTPSAGLVRIKASGFFFSLDANGQGYVAIYKNGALVVANASNAGGSGSAFPAVDMIDNANGTDFYEMYGYVTSVAGGTLSGSSFYTSFQGHQI